MSILGPDNDTDGLADDERVAVTTPTGSTAAVVAVDTPNVAGRDVRYNTLANLPGSGIAISSDFVLTASHVTNGNANAQVTIASAVPGLAARGIANAPATTNATVVHDFNPASDIALLQTGADITTDGAALGMAVFYNHRDLDGLQMVTAGYPFQASNNGLIPAPDTTARSLYLSTDVIKLTSETTFKYDADTQGGQSGSGVWLDSASYTGDLQNSGAGDLLVGIHVGLLGSNIAERITSENYKTITDAMETAAGSNAAAEAANLPMSVLVGSEAGFWSFLTGSGDDYIDGSYLREAIYGQSGSDRIEGGGADDTIDGGEGVDQALFSSALSEYTFTITDATDPDNPQVQIAHSGGSQSDGTDTLSNVEFAVFDYVDTSAYGASGYGVDDDGNVMYVPLLADLDDPTKLRDGTQITVSQDVTDDLNETIGSISVEIPAFMFDGDVNYTLNIGAESNILYNFVYIVDSSGSMRGNNIQETKAAYVALTNSLVLQGIAQYSQFAVVDFDSYSRLYSGLDAQGAIDTVNGLSAGGGTRFGPALADAESWFDSLGNVGNATNIAFFLSDGFGSGASADLQLVNEASGTPATVDVRAFGIGRGADLVGLNVIDSDNAVLLTDPSDLTDAFATSGFSRDTIERIDVKLDGFVVDTISPDQLTDGTLGLIYEGEITGLEVAFDADNRVEFELVFNDGTPTVSIESRITTGQSEVRTQSRDGTVEVVALAVNQDDYVIQGTAEIVSGNGRDNTITVDSGSQTVDAGGGNDTFIVNGGISVFDGGDGTDTAIYSITLAEAGGVQQTGGIITVGTGDTFINTEFIQFSDVLIDTSIFAEVLTATLDTESVSLSEADAGTTQATFTVTLSGPATSEITLDYATRDGTAEDGSDYTGTTGNLTFAVGEQTKTITIDILQDAEIESDEGFFVDLTLGSGAVFDDNSDTRTVGVSISDDDAEISLSVVGDNPTFAEGSSGSGQPFSVTLTRTGDLSGTDVIDWSVAAGSALAEDFGGTLPSGTATFDPGQDTASIDITILGDIYKEADETFTLALSQASGDAVLLSTSQEFTILNDDVIVTLDTESVTLSESDAGTTQATFTVTLSDPAPSEITLDYATRDGTAADGSDYTGTTGNLTFAVGEQTKTITIDILQDTEVEGDEGFFVDLTLSGSAAFDDNSNTRTVGVSISDDDAEISLSVVGGSSTFAEGNSGSGQPFSVTLTRTGDLSGTDVIDWSVAAGSALAEDFGGTLPSGTATFDPGQDTASIDITILGDIYKEADETFTLALSQASGDAVLLSTSQEFTILNDDVIIKGTPGADLIEGTSGDDIIEGDSGDDSILGGEGDDLILGEDGADTLYGGDGIDTLNGGDGNDSIIGGETDADLRDVIFGGTGNDSIDAGYGNDLVYGQDGNDTIFGGFGADDLQGQNGNDVITGGALSDLIYGGDGDDFVNGGFGHDRINGGAGADKFYHVGVEGHGSDWVQDYNASEGDVLLFGNVSATVDDFQINLAHTATLEGERSGDDDLSEAFVIYKPTGQIMWALVDGEGQDEINIKIGGEVFDLLA